MLSAFLQNYEIMILVCTADRKGLIQNNDATIQTPVCQLYSEFLNWFPPVSKSCKTKGGYILQFSWLNVCNVVRAYVEAKQTLKDKLFEVCLQILSHRIWALSHVLDWWNSSQGLEWDQHLSRPLFLIHVHLCTWNTRVTYCCFVRFELFWVYRVGGCYHSPSPPLEERLFPPSPSWGIAEWSFHIPPLNLQIKNIKSCQSVQRTTWCRALHVFWWENILSEPINVHHVGLGDRVEITVTIFFLNIGHGMVNVCINMQRG